MFMMKKMRIWLPIAFTTSLLSTLILTTVQQNFRQGANDPQIQIAQDSAQNLISGKNEQDIVGQNQIDISKSLAPFIIIFNDDGKPIASQAVLDGRIPTPPTGVFDYTKTHKEDRITWQPKEGVRIAAVLERFEGSKPGFVLSGRSLKEIELREEALNHFVLFGWAGSILGTLILVLLLA